MVSSQRGELFCTISRLKSSQYLFYITHENILIILYFLIFEKENVEISISQNANPKNQMPVLEARRPSLNLGLVKLSSKSTVKYSNSIIKSVINKVVNILTVSFNVC